MAIIFFNIQVKNKCPHAGSIVVFRTIRTDKIACWVRVIRSWRYPKPVTSLQSYCSEIWCSMLVTHFYCQFKAHNNRAVWVLKGNHPGLLTHNASSACAAHEQAHRQNAKCFFQCSNFPSCCFWQTVFLQTFYVWL